MILYVYSETYNANSGDPDETAGYQPAHLNLHCLQMYMSLVYCTIVILFSDEQIQ